MTPEEVRGYCMDLSIQRRALAKQKSADCALKVQKAKASMNDGAREMRASFKVLAGGKR